MSELIDIPVTQDFGIRIDDVVGMLRIPEAMADEIAASIGRIEWRLCAATIKFDSGKKLQTVSFAAVPCVEKQDPPPKPQLPSTGVLFPGEADTVQTVATALVLRHNITVPVLVEFMQYAAHLRDRGIGLKHVMQAVDGWLALPEPLKPTMTTQARLASQFQVMTDGEKFAVQYRREWWIWQTRGGLDQGKEYDTADEARTARARLVQVRVFDDIKIDNVCEADRKWVPVEEAKP